MSYAFYFKSPVDPILHLALWEVDYKWLVDHRFFIISETLIFCLHLDDILNYQFKVL